MITRVKLNVIDQKRAMFPVPIRRQALLSQYSLVACCILWIPFITGCGDENPPVARAVGIVTYRGNPVQSGKVYFVPVGGGKRSRGVIQPDGSFKLSTFGNNDGALVGNHRAVILDTIASANKGGSLSVRSSDQLAITVKPAITNEFSFDLSSANWQLLPK